MPNGCFLGMAYASLNLYSGIIFDVLFTIAAVVCDPACFEIDIVPDNTGTPRRRQELRERAVSGLIGSQRGNESFPVECRHVVRTGYQRRRKGHDRPIGSQINALACGQQLELA